MLYCVPSEQRVGSSSLPGRATAFLFNGLRENAIPTDHLLVQQRLFQLSHTPTRRKHYSLKHLQSLPQHHKLRFSVHSVQQPQLRPALVSQRTNIGWMNRTSRLRVAGRGILRNHGRNNNSPETPSAIQHAHQFVILGSDCRTAKMQVGEALPDSGSV